MKDSTIFGVLVVVLLVAAAGVGVLVISQAGSTAKQAVRQEAEDTQRRASEALREAEESYEASLAELEAQEKGRADLSLLSIRVAENINEVRAALYYSYEAEAPIWFDPERDSLEVRYAGGETQPVPLENLFELDEMKLNPGEKSIPVSIRLPGDDREIIGVRFTREREDEEDFELFHAVDLREAENPNG